MVPGMPGCETMSQAVAFGPWSRIDKGGGRAVGPMSERVSILRSSSDSTPFSSRLAATLSRPVFDQSTADFSRAHSLLPAHAGCTCSHNARGASSDERSACAMINIRF